LKSWIEISAVRLAENLRAVQSAVGSQVEVVPVVKANGYGHNASSVAPILVKAGAKWLGVDDAEEGARVREALQENSTRLLVMCGMELEDAPLMAQHGLTPVVWTVEHVAAMEKAARSVGHRLAVHLEIDTGMARQGATLESGTGVELDKVLERLAASRWVSCEGVMSHLSSSEVSGSEITVAQREKFAAALERVAAVGVKPEFVHLGNSSAVDEASTTPWVRDAAKKMHARAMVRPGLAIYGDCLSTENKQGTLIARLKPVMTWKTNVIGLREIEPGTTVGYGATFVAKAPMRLALLPVGYADGFRREASSGVGDGWVRIAGSKASVVGRVSMNLTVVDVTEIPAATVGSEAVVLGEGVTADDHARWAGTIPYEILCGVRGKFVVV